MSDASTSGGMSLQLLEVVEPSFGLAPRSFQKLQQLQ